MTQPLRILILEDNPDDAELVLHQLRRSGFDPVWERVETEAQYLAHLDENLDVVLADYSLPQFNAPRALACLQRAGLDIPFIVVSGAVGDEQAVECMKQGAADYVLKDRMGRLGQVVERALEEKRLRGERARAAEALRESEEQLRRVVESDMIGIVFWNPQGLFYDANDVFLRMVGHTRDELLAGDLSWNAMTPPEYAEADSGALQELARTGHCKTYEKELLRKDGSRVPVLAGAATLKNSSNTGVAFMLDITERKQMDLDLRRSRDELEIRVRERTAELASANSQLVVAKEAADSANHAKSEFLSRMSHELRTPLNAILGFGQMLEMDELTPLQMASVSHILKGGAHLLNLINEVLDLARIEAGGMHVSLEAVPVCEIVRECVALLSPVATQRQVTIDLTNCENDRSNDIFVNADRQRLKQVLLNLLGNAIKYNRDGGRVAVVCDNAPSQNGETPRAVRIAVQDTGPGIPPEKMERLFVPFDRLGAEQTRVEGTGLGLALSRRLVEAMQGTMGVTSEAGAGSSFWFELAAAERPSTQDELQRPASVAKVIHTKRTVLYVEDNLSNFKLIEQILRLRPGVELLAAMQGSVGIELARQHRPDLILLDIHLPDMSGHEVLLRLRADPATRESPVIVLSADATPGQMDRLKIAGARDYLTKPLNVKHFLRVLDDALQSERTQNPTGTQ